MNFDPNAPNLPYPMVQIIADHEDWNDKTAMNNYIREMTQLNINVLVTCGEYHTMIV